MYALIHLYMKQTEMLMEIVNKNKSFINEELCDSMSPATVDICI